MTEEVDQSSAGAADEGFEWAIVEIMGHRRHAGRTREEERFGAKMLRVDVPHFSAPRSLFDHADGKPADPEIVWTSHYYSGAAIFSFTLTDEATVMRINKPAIPPSRYLSKPDDEPDFDNEYDDD